MNNSIFEDILDIKPGTFHRFQFKSEVPVKAKCKGDISIVKYTTITGRTGIKYQPKVSTNTDNKPRTNNFISIIKNKLRYNTITSNYYLTIVPRADSRPECKYAVSDIDGTRVVDNLNDYREYVISSYFHEKSDCKFMAVKLDNVLNIN